MLKKKKTTASGKLVLVKSVRRTRSHRMKSVSYTHLDVYKRQDLVREEQQRSRTQRAKLEPSRPSVRDKLKQELPAHKPAAPKKQEPER